MDKIIDMPEMQEQNESIESLKNRIEELTTQVEKMEALIKYYEHQFLKMKRRQFGASSEKFSIDTKEYRQNNLFGNAAQEELKKLTEPEAETEEITYKRKKQKGKREEDLTGLPVERIDYEIPEEERACPECGGAMRDIGTDIRRELKIIPAQVIVVEHAAHTYACPNCQNNSDSTPIIKTEPAAAALIPGSLASASIVAYIATQKYLNGMPLYRIEKGFVYDGVIISRQTMANWVIKCAGTFLVGIYLLMISYLLKAPALHADETTVQVLREYDRPAQRKSYEWVYRTSGSAEHQIIIFEYKETRKQEHPRAFLRGFKGLLHCDGYQVYHGLPVDIIIIGCWAHARRKWENLLKTLPEDKRTGSEAERGLFYINLLFEYEREFYDLTPEERYIKRLEISKPVADEFFAWVDTLGALPKSPLGEPVHYALSQKQYLMHVFVDGRAELSNNLCENSIRPFVRGRKAWLFSATPDGAYASSVIYSIIETAKENGLHPYHYIKFLLETLPNIKNSELDAFLPWSKSLPDYCYTPLKN
jgi:transposase